MNGNTSQYFRNYLTTFTLLKPVINCTVVLYSVGLNFLCSVFFVNFIFCKAPLI